MLIETVCQAADDPQEHGVKWTQVCWVFYMNQDR